MIDKLREFLANLNFYIDEQVFSPTENVYLAKLTDFNTNFSKNSKNSKKLLGRVGFQRFREA